MLAPLAVMPEFQKCGIGSDLVESLKMRLAEAGINMLFVYGDPAYYGRFGFDAASAAGCIPPCKIKSPFGGLVVGLNGFRCELASGRLNCVTRLCDPALW
jgi:putative acetyltransferase